MRIEDKHKDLHLMPHQWDPFNGDYHLEKMILQYKSNYGIDSAIECGTCLGSSALWFADNFQKVTTIEINKAFFDIAGERLSVKDNVELILADTRDVLADVIKSMGNNYFIFIDSHWGDNNPLLDELAIIAKSGTQPIIAIHDFKNPHVPTMGYDEYPKERIVYEWGYVASAISKIYPNGFNIRYNLIATEVNRGCIFASAQTKP